MDIQQHKERWAKADGFNGIVEVSDAGRIRRIERRVWSGNGNGAKVIKAGSICQWMYKSGYLGFTIRLSGIANKALVHRVVAFAFCAGYMDGLTVNHINGIKTDNRARNLEWVTKARNTELQWSTGLIDIRGEKHPMHKLTKAQAIYAFHSTERVAMIASELRVSQSLIYKIKKGERWPDAL